MGQAGQFHGGPHRSSALNLYLTVIAELEVELA
jgi:hypothetical protein